MLYIVLFLHQTTTVVACSCGVSGCISYYSYIKPQLFDDRRFLSYSCISYYSYIKPQLIDLLVVFLICCISYYSYIKPQLDVMKFYKKYVVYRTIPTSNHNRCFVAVCAYQLYIVLFLHQTTTTLSVRFSFVKLYIVLFLHQTTTDEVYDILHRQLYIVLFLHQTTTRISRRNLPVSCISYYSYIKPQPLGDNKACLPVVYRTIPTSNHNLCRLWLRAWLLYIVLFLHQTTTYAWIFLRPICCISYYSYIKPQLADGQMTLKESCISYYSYIKPQLFLALEEYSIVVYRTIPTSNHNL